MATTRKSKAKAEPEAKPKTTPEAPAGGTSLRVDVVGFGPSDFHGTLDEGINLLSGRNGEGKSQVLVALLWALGDKSMRPRLRHGASEGFVEINGQRIATLDKEMSEVADNERALYYQSLITEAIIPNVTDPKRAEPRRVAAVMELVDIPLTEEAMLTLTSDDDEVLKYALEREPGIANKSVTDAADRLAYWAHYLKREVYGVEADKAQGRIDGAKVPKPDVLSEIGSDEAKLLYDRAVRDHDRKSGEAEQRAKQVEQQKEIRETLGERPDAESVQRELALAGTALQEIADVRGQIELEIAKLQERLQGLREAHLKARDRRDRAEETVIELGKAAVSWDRRKAILDAVITGATAEDVGTANAAAQTAYSALLEAQATEAYETACVVVEKAAADRDLALKDFKRVEKVAQGVTRQLAKLFNDVGIEGLTVADGVLMKVHEDSTLEPVVDLSAGQRAKLLLPLLERHKFPYGIIVIPESFHASLQPSAQKEMHEEFAARGYRVLVERPTDEQGLRVEKAGNT